MGVNPLTGRYVTDAALLERRPMMVKVGNFPVQGRPHSGLSFADLVFEYYIGEGMTRFVAVFYGKDAPQVGPIRSGRLIDAQVTRLYGGILGMKGADPYVGGRIAAALPGRLFYAKPAACPALCPYTTSHTYGTFADTSAFSKYTAEQGGDTRRPDLSGTIFDSAVPRGGSQAHRLWLFYSYLNQVAWEYDGDAGVYVRLQDNADALLAPMTDKLTGEQLGFGNVVLLFTSHEFLSPTIIDIDLWHAQDRPGLIFRDGQVFSVRWFAASPDLPLRFADQEGRPFPFRPGATWFEVVGMGSLVEELEPGSWKVRFYP